MAGASSHEQEHGATRARGERVVPIPRGKARSVFDALAGTGRVIAAELRPPRAELEGHEGMDAWIDTYHAVHRLTRGGTCVFLTDSAVGTEEEDNLRHLVTNLGRDA